MIYRINLNRKNILGYDRTLRYFLIYDRNSKYSKVIIDKFNLIVYHTALMSPGLLNSIWQAVKSLLVKIGRAQTAIVMADAGKSFFMGGGDNLAVFDQTSGGVMVEAGEAQDVHNALIR